MVFIVSFFIQAKQKESVIKKRTFGMNFGVKNGIMRQSVVLK